MSAWSRVIGRMRSSVVAFRQHVDHLTTNHPACPDRCAQGRKSDRSEPAGPNEYRAPRVSRTRGPASASPTRIAVASSISAMTRLGLPRRMSSSSIAGRSSCTREYAWSISIDGAHPGRAGLERPENNVAALDREEAPQALAATEGRVTHRLDQTRLPVPSTGGSRLHRSPFSTCRADPRSGLGRQGRVSESPSGSCGQRLLFPRSRSPALVSRAIVRTRATGYG